MRVVAYFASTLLKAPVQLLVLLWVHCEGRYELRGSRIKISAIGVSETERSQASALVCAALAMMDIKDTWRRARIERQIKTIVLTRLGSDGSYLPMGRICGLNLRRLLAVKPNEVQPFLLAGLLVHEATHGILDGRRIPCCGAWKERVEVICNDEQARTMNRLMNG